MAPLPPPQGMSEADYETIEAAVTETVRGRWFLGEFARRNRAAELRQLLDAMARIESAVSAGAPALPPADPSIRLMMQRIKEIASQLEAVSAEMRDAGIDPRFPDAVDHQARAVSGMLRSPGRGALSADRHTMRTDASPPIPKLPNQHSAARAPQIEAPNADIVPSGHRERDAAPFLGSPTPTAPVRMPRADLPLGFARPADPSERDPRLDALSALDRLALAKKLSLFS